MSIFPQIPKHWTTAPLQEVVDINPTLDKSEIDDEMEVSFVPMMAVAAETGNIDTNQKRKFFEVKKGYTPFQKYDILFAKITPCMENGKMAVVPDLHNAIGFGSTEFHVLRALKGMEPKFIYYFVSSKEFRFNAEHNMTGAVGQKRVSTDYLKKHPFPVPPTNEQKRIVTKIEELFSELDKCIENLKTAREQLKIYRQAVLKYALEGKITAKWREKKKDKLDDLDHFLVRIDQEREAAYQFQLEKWRSSIASWEKAGKKGKRPTKPQKQKNVSTLTDEERDILPGLPNGWGWVKLGQLVWSVKDGPHYSPKYAESGIPFISGGNIRPDGIDFETAKFISSDLHRELSERCKPEVGDVLYTKGGTTGIARVNTYDLDFNVWVHVAVLKITKSLSPFFLQHSLNSSFCYAQSQKYTHGVGNQDLGLTRLVNIILSICGIEEQEIVVREVERHMSVLESLDISITQSLEKSEALRQSILKKAFSGQLVAQNQKDESAGVLLDRIHAEKNATKPSNKKPKDTRKVA